MPRCRRSICPIGAWSAPYSGLVLKAGLAHIFHVGDSCISLLRNSTLEPLTRDYLAKAMGIDPDLEVDYRAAPLEASDILVFTTDGVHDHMEPSPLIQTITDHMAEHGDLDAAARAIMDQAHENGSEDNLTCQLVRVVDPGQPDRDSHLRQLTALPFPPDLSPGSSFEGYRIIGELHASNRVQVYLAVDEVSKDKVVIKTPSVNFEDEPAYIEMFTREEWVGRRLANSHVVRVITTPGPKRFLYYLTEYIEGDTLCVWMENNPKPKLAEVRHIVEQIATGLRAFHRKDILHQDLKPENIIIDEFGNVKIIDFGSSGIPGLDEIDVAANFPIDHPMLVGTLGYTAPEYHLGHKATNRADIFALGVIAYEMLTGKLPYGEGFANAKAAASLKPTPAIAHDPAIPPWVSAALAKATARDVNKRYDALSAFTHDLAHPNTALISAETRPLIERNPLVFWKYLALASILINLALIYLLASTRRGCSMHGGLIAWPQMT